MTVILTCGDTTMIYWWSFLMICCFHGTFFGSLIEHPYGWLIGLTIGFVVGTLPPVGPYIPFNPEDL